MAVIWVRELVDDRTGSMDNEFHRDYQRSFLIELDDPTTPELAILLSGYVPLVNASHPNDLIALAQKPTVSVPDSEAPYFRKVTVPYSTRPRSGPSGGDPNRQDQSPDASPLAQPPDVHWTHVVTTRLFTESADGTIVKMMQNGAVVVSGGNPVPAVLPGQENGKPAAIMNSVGEVPDPAPEIEKRRLKLTVARNEATFNPQEADLYIDTTNSDTFQGFGAGHARMVEYDGKRGYGKKVAYFVVTRSFEFDDLGWDYIMRDAGSFSFPPNPGAVMPGDAGSISPNSRETKDRAESVKSNGTPIQRVNLNGAGVALGPNDAPVYLRFRKFPRMDFSTFNLINL